MALPATLKGFTAIVDGYGTFGILNSGQLPKLSTKMDDFRDGGMDGVVELDMGQEKMESELVFAEYRQDLLSMWGLLGQTTTFILNGSLEDDTGDVIPIVATMTGVCKMEDPGDWKAGGEKSELKLQLSVRFYQLAVDGVETHYIDVENCIRRINGVDQLAARRQALGI
jgi:P2 family phage contractile tail tube protein